MIKKILLAFCLILLPVTVFSEEGLPIPRGFWNGNDWKDNEPLRHAYAMGVVDGMLFASALERGGGVSLDWLKPCVEGKRSDQLLAVLQNEIDLHPELLHDGMHKIAYRALLKACPNAPKYTPTK